jgi:hypothetical protein
MLWHTLADARDRWNGQRTIGGFACQHLCHEREPWWIQRREHHVEVWHVRAMIFPITSLEQPILGHTPVPTRRCALQAHPLRHLLSIRNWISPYKTPGSSRLNELYYSLDHFQTVLVRIFSAIDSPK